MHQYEMIILIWNIVVMLIYGLDKLLAKMGTRRISEATLILCTFFLGGPGAMFGMVLFRHKTSKMKFRLLVPLATAFTIAGIFYLVNFLSLT